MAGMLLLDELEQMTTLLGTMARCVASGRSLNQAELQRLLRDVGLEPEPELLAELEQWSALLGHARARGVETVATDTVEALTLRGVSEASAVLAVATATAAISHVADEAPPVHGSRSGTSGSVDPWPPRAFGPERLGHSAKLVVASDGTGTHHSLAAALDAARPGATILLKRGVHYLKRGYLLKQPVTLLGEGTEDTELVAHQGQFVLAHQRSGLFELRDLTVRWAGPASVVASVVAVSDGEVHFERCRFLGAESAGLGAGLLFTGMAAGSVRSCRLEANGAGIAIQDRASVTLDDNVCRENSGHGIRYSGRATGTARSNTCVANGYDGISVQDAALPLLEGNICQDNGWSGVGCAGDSDATVHHNICMGNHHSGIHVREQSQPVLQENRCAENRDSGISYAGSSGGAAIDNECTANAKYGICVAQDSRPLLTTNVVSDNHDTGIAYFGRGAGTAQGNNSKRNAHHGIYVGDQARPTLDTNVCERNRWTGLAYFGSAGGKAARNRCSRNGKRDLYVERGARPLLQANILHADQEAGPTSPMLWASRALHRT